MPLINDEVNQVIPAAAVVQQPPLNIGRVLTVFGPVMPPHMQWSKCFEKLFPLQWVSHIPRFLPMHDIKIVVTSKRSWTVAFDDNLSFRISTVPHASARKFRPRSPCKPVARRISFDDDVDPPSTGVVGNSVSMPSCMLEQAMDF